MTVGVGAEALVGGTLATWLRRTFVPVGLVVIMWAAVAVPLPLYTERPGASLDLSECVVIADAAAGDIRGNLLLTFASQRRAAVADLVLATFDDSVQLQPLREVVGEQRPQDHFARQRAVFDTSTRTAAAVGLDRAGWPEPSVVTGDGAGVVEVLDDFPAAGVLAPGDVVVAADGRPIQTSDELRALIVDGGPIELTVHRGAETAVVRLTPIPSDIDGELRPVIGAQLSTVNPQVLLPLEVNVRAGRIGGPSAGLMIALGVYDAVADEDLLAGRRVAGTGTITADGGVGRIGKLPLKVAAAAAQGASLFLAPASQADAARAAVPPGSSLQVVGVDTIDEAIDAIRAAPRAEPVSTVRFRSCADRATAVRSSPAASRSG